MTCGPLAGLALGLTAPALAAGHDDPLRGVGPGMHAGPHHGPVVQPIPGAPPLPGGPDMRPVWQGAGGPVMLPDPRTRDAWLDECHRRTTMYYGGSRKKHRRNRDDWRRRDSAYTYCEAYFDDYYRTYTHRGPAYGHGYAYAVPVYAAPMMMTHAPVVQPAKENCVETVTTTYEPVRTRVIPRRPAPRRVIPDKRIRVVPDKRLPAD